MFGWIRRILGRRVYSPPLAIEAKPYEPEQLRFVRGLCESHPNVKPSMRLALGYIYKFTFMFPDVKMEVEYNVIRKEWDIELWSFATGFLYYYDCISPKPRSTIAYVVDRYDLRKKVEEAKQLQKAKDDGREQNAADLKSKYLSK